MAIVKKSNQLLVLYSPADYTFLNISLYYLLHQHSFKNKSWTEITLHLNMNTQ